MFDALELSTTCGVTPPKDYYDSSKATTPHLMAAVENDAAAATFYVDPQNGSDSATGSADHPFKTVARAVNATRGVAGAGAVVLKEARLGCHHAI